MPLEQTTSSIVMIEPEFFNFNADAAKTNSYMKEMTDDGKTAEVRKKAMEESENLEKVLREAGVNVIKFRDTESPHTPDAVFPNNWFSTHSENGGTVILYPMLPENRRLERRPDLIEALSTEYGFYVKAIVDLSPGEKESEILEGTGSMVLDRINKVAYASKSPRTTEEVLQRFARLMGYEVVLFETKNQLGGNDQIYHTNVVMSVGEKFAVVCLDAVIENKDGLVHALESSEHEIIPIDNAQMNAFAGNMLEVRNNKNESIIVMSESAFQFLNADQLDRLGKHGKILHVPLETIEKHGGGSARCMMAEVFLPRKQ